MPKTRTCVMALLLACVGAGAGACSEGDGASPTAVAPDGTVNLAPGYSRATPAVYEHVLRSHDWASVPIAGETEVSALVTRRFGIEVVEARADGTARVAFRMRKVAFHIEPSHQAAYDFDSESNPGAEDDPVAAALRSLAAMEFEAEMGADGKVKELATFAAALNKIVRPPDKVESLFAGSWFAAALENVWLADEGDLRRRIGETWTATVPSTIPEGSASAETVITHTLSGVEDGVAVIEGDGVLEILWGTDPRTRGTQSRIEDQRFVFKKQWDLEQGALGSLEIESMIRYFINHGGGLDQKVQRELDSSLRRLDAPDAGNAGGAPAEGR